MPHILNLDNIVDDVANRRIFLGTYSGFQRFDVYKYPFAKQIEEKMRNAFWNPNEISLVTDRIKFAELPPHTQEVITLNLLFQTLMDSAQSRGLDTVMAEITTSPEWEGVFKTQAYFEQIHSLSYSHIIREVFPDATAVFDRLQDLPEIVHRIDKEISLYNMLLNDYDSLNDEEKKFRILELVLRVYGLEGLKFYVSFLVTYVINYSYHSPIQGITRIIKLINFDEDMHVAVMGGLFNILKRNPDEGFAKLIGSSECANLINSIFPSIVADEIEWGRFLLKQGQIPTLTEGVIEKFVQWYGNDRITNIGYHPLFNVEKIDVVDWFEEYKNIDKDNVAGQEAESVAYKVGILKNDIPEGRLPTENN